jgi:hypothetical protein
MIGIALIWIIYWSRKISENGSSGKHKNLNFLVASETQRVSEWVSEWVSGLGENQCLWVQLGQSRVKVTLWPTVSRTVRLGVRPARDRFLILFDISFRQLRVCYFAVPSLTIRRVCNLLLLLVPSQRRPARFCPLWREVGSVFYQCFVSISL